MIDYYYEQLNFTERRIYKSIYVSIVNKESYDCFLLGTL